MTAVITTPLGVFHICICICLLICICILLVCASALVVFFHYFLVTLKMIPASPESLFSFLKDNCNPVKETSQGENVSRPNFSLWLLLHKVATYIVEDGQDLSKFI